MTISVLLLGLPQMLHDILTHAIDHDPQMALVPAGQDQRQTTAPDAVIVEAGPDGELASIRPILREWPRSIVVAIETGAKRTSFYELQPQMTPLGEISPAELLRFLRVKAQEARWS